MQVKINIGISNRHCHLTEETYKLLFDEMPNKVRDLNQLGEYATDKTVTISTPSGEFENVRILCPFRKYNQVEVSLTDAYKLKNNPPVRRSGELDGAASITLTSSKGSITINACIQADRHVHMNPQTALKLGLNDKDKVYIKTFGEKSGILEALVKVSDNGFFEAHFDTDDANSLNIAQNSEGIMIIPDKGIIDLNDNSKENIE